MDKAYGQCVHTGHRDIAYRRPHAWARFAAACVRSDRPGCMSSKPDCAAPDSCSLLGGRGAGPRRRHDKQRQCHLSSAATTRSNTQRCQATHTKGKTGPGRWVTYRKTLIQKSVQQDVRYIWEIPIDGLRGGYVVHLRRQQPGSTAGPLGPTDLFKPATSPRTDAVESTWTH